MHSTTVAASVPAPTPSRLDHLDAVRAFALLLGIIFHASLSFMDTFIGWAVVDVSTGKLVDLFVVISHSFRMEVFFLIAGFFSHLTFHRKGAGAFLASRGLRVAVPFIVGWFILRPLVVSGWIIGQASMRGQTDWLGGLRDGFMSLQTLPTDIFVGTHLWFLYYLLLITAFALILRVLAKMVWPLARPLVGAADRALHWMAGKPWSIYLFALPTAWAIKSMGRWSVDTPDKSLTPYWTVIAVYGGFFGLGWMLRRNQILNQFMRLSFWHGIIAALSITACVMLAPIQGDPGHPEFARAETAYAFTYALMMWSLVTLCIGGFAKLIRGSSPAVLYVADSSYWMYLIHLPIVIWLQVVVAEWPIHWSFKLVGISAATIGISLLTYDLFVRSTFIGKTLNGRKRDRVIFRRQSRDTVAATTQSAAR